MATVTTQFVKNYVGAADDNPHTDADIASVIGGAGLQILNGRLWTLDTGYTYQMYRYTGTVNRTIKRAALELLEGTNYNADGLVMIDASGNGYMVRIRYGAEAIYLDRVLAGTIDVALGDSEYIITFEAGDQFYLDVDTSTATNNVVVYHYDASLDTTTAIITASDGTHTANLAPGVMYQSDGNGVGIASWGGDVTSGVTRSADSIDTFQRGATGSIISCTGLDAAPTTQTVTVTDGTHSDTCTINSWSATAITIDVDCVLPPGTYDIQVTDDTGTVTLADQILLIEEGYEEVVFDGITPPGDEESLSQQTIADYPAIPEIIAGDSWGVQSDANITWATDGQASLIILQTHTLPYWFWDDSTGTMYLGTITIAEEATLSNQSLTLQSGRDLTAAADTNLTTGSGHYYLSTSATPPSRTDLAAGTGAVDYDLVSGGGTSGTKSTTVTGNADGTDFYLHVMWDNSGVYSDIVSVGPVATEAAPANNAPVVDPQSFYALVGAVSSSEYIDLTGLTSEGGTVTDFESITRTIPAGIPLREGCRVVENICVAPSDLQDASWIPSNGAVVLNATQWQTGTGGVNSQMRTAQDASVQVGERYRVHLKLAIADKSVATSWRIGFYMAGGGSAPGDWIDITADVSDQEQWLTSPVAEITAVGTGLYAIVHAIGSTGVTTITQSEFFIEEVTGQVNQNPSTFVDGFAYSDYENGNTVVNNVVVPGQGAGIDNAMYWLSVGTVAASDPDLDTLTYSITAGNTDGDIAINPATGELAWFHAPDPNRTPTYNLTVQVSDGELTASAAVTVTVLAVSSGGDSEDGFICSIIKSLIQPLVKDVIN
ncbi:MAG: cadherin repeat domain-containing protein [Candidatus Thiodiazotropha lotti]|nr:cadherin repeat domain-containing protein [Candidatus Thiodiazotropha lotti]